MTADEDPTISEPFDRSVPTPDEAILVILTPAEASVVQGRKGEQMVRGEASAGGKQTLMRLLTFVVQFSLPRLPVQYEKSEVKCNEHERKSVVKQDRKTR